MFFSDHGGVQWLVVFLGNPGLKYRNTRHNAGFLAADAVERDCGVPIDRLRFHALTAQAELGGQKVLLMKPQTYMNNSGEAVAPAAKFYKVPPEHILVVSDEIHLQPGRLRIRTKGSAGGHNGLKSIIAGLHEFNPMMGHRGCRLCVTYPEIAVMQTNAVIKAALNVKKRHPDWDIVPEIMIPLVGEVKELKYVKNVVVETADKVIAESGMELHYKVGTMIEIPRAALTADQIATEAEFFSFGTNDLTQMTFGFSRDDAGKFLDAYYANKIYESDPFARLDQTGVAVLLMVFLSLL